jgi:hypothetical protein
MKTFPILFCILCMLAAHSAALAETAVTNCGQHVTDGVLTGDLDCSAQVSGFAVSIESDGSLDLAGHRMISPTAPERPSATGGGIFCEGDCRVRGGGGSIVSIVPVDFDPAHRNLPEGIVSPYPRQSTVSVSNVTISGFWEGVNAHVVRARQVVATGNVAALVGTRMRISGATLTANNQGVAAFRAHVSNSEISGNGNGMILRRVKLLNSDVVNNRFNGIIAADGGKPGRLWATDSSIDGNCADAEPDDDCWDFSTSGGKVPELVNSHCSTSGRFVLSSQTWTSWHLCSND